MKTEKSVKDTARDVADKVHNGVDAAEEKLDETVEAFGARLAQIETLLRENGERLLASAKEIGDVASKQVRTYPLAAFGIAFVAGIALARMLRR
ncbi:MAG TPA: hypothetical protein VFB32_01175 [Rudaea sp.]|nr:hypothetical protein [Rudaea sp.]